MVYNISGKLNKDHLNSLFMLSWYLAELYFEESTSFPNTFYLLDVCTVHTRGFARR